MLCVPLFFIRFSETEKCGKKTSQLWQLTLSKVLVISYLLWYWHFSSGYVVFEIYIIIWPGTWTERKKSNQGKKGRRKKWKVSSRGTKPLKKWGRQIMIFSVSRKITYFQFLYIRLLQCLLHTCHVSDRTYGYISSYFETGKLNA